MKNLCRELNFSCAGGRRVLTTRLQNERERLSTNTPQSNIQTVPVNHTLSNSNARESFSADQLAQITQIVSQSISSFFESQPATTTATRVDEQPTIPPLPTPLERLEQLSQFPFLSSSELQQQPTSSHGPVASIQQAEGGFTPEIPNKYVRDIESANQISAASKPDFSGFRASATITIGSNSGMYCPVRALQTYLSRAPTDYAGPLFCYSNGVPLSRSQFTKELRILLAQGGRHPAHYAGHSFRIGAPTTAASQGLPHWLIQTLGRWSSDCYLRYIRTRINVLTDVSKRLIAEWDKHSSVVCRSMGITPTIVVWLWRQLLQYEVAILPWTSRFLYGIGQHGIQPIPIYKITLFLHMSICTEPDQCSKKYFPNHFFPGPSSKYMSCKAG